MTSSEQILLAAVQHDDGDVSIVGQATSSQAGQLVIPLDHRSDCGEINFELLEGGAGGWLTVTSAAGEESTFSMSHPWAVDEAGDQLKTWYEYDGGSTLLQVIETSGASGSIVFDPTYTAISCWGYYADGSAAFYLNLDPNDGSWCVPRGMFTAAQDTGYYPVWGDQPSVTNDYGKVMVRQDGECSFVPDTGPHWDFQVPCKAHDYCYDLRKAGFSGTVSDSDCDWALLDLAYADCNDRNPAAQLLCEDFADNMWVAVKAPWVVTDPNPGVVEIRNLRTGKCADIEGPSTANNVPIQQWSCVGVSNQRFKIWPASGAPGYFQIKPTHSNKCARALTDPVQYGCQNWNSMRFKIQGALNQDQYSIRSKYHEYECWKVPNSWGNGVDLVDPSCDDYSSWYIWRIVDV